MKSKNPKPQIKLALKTKHFTNIKLFMFELVTKLIK